MKTRDLELLSAYLDGALPLEQMRRLEQRIKADPQLRAELEALQQTRALLRQMPRHRAPRNFTLSPRQVAKRPPLPRFYPLLQWSTALTLVFLVISLGLQFVAFPMTTHEYAPAMRAMSAEGSTQVPLFLPAEGDLTPTPESVQPGILALPTSTPEMIQPGIMALPQETPVPKAPPISTVAPSTEAVEVPPTGAPFEVSPALARPISPLAMIVRSFAFLIALELFLLLFLRWWSARRWRKSS